MDFIPGEKLVDLLQQDNIHFLAKQIGKKISQLHQKHIIHGDLTTSNMIQHQDTKELHFIDFGLSFFSERAEDKAVDLFLLDRALESKHYQLYPEIFNQVLASYVENNPQAQTILNRFQKVKARGRNKNK